MGTTTRVVAAPLALGFWLAAVCVLVTSSLAFAHDTGTLDLTDPIWLTKKAEEAHQEDGQTPAGNRHDGQQRVDAAPRVPRPDLPKVRRRRDHGSRHRRRSVSPTASQEAGRYYKSAVSYTHESMQLPDLNNASHGILHQGDSTRTGAHIHVQLPFNFSFFGHFHDHVFVSTYGFIFAHPLPSDCAPYACRLVHMVETSYIAPLIGVWAGLANNNSQLVQYTAEDKTFVHFVWSVRLLSGLCHTDVRGVRTCGTRQGTETQFSATLYSDGAIEFHYDKLGARSAYDKFNFHSASYGGTIGLRDSSIHDHAAGVYDHRYVRYADANISTVFNGSVRPKSITFTPLTTPVCFTALDETECKARSPSLACFWCPLPPGYNLKTRPFCTDGGHDRNYLHYRATGCSNTTDGAVLSFANDTVLRHTYYTASMSTAGLRLPDLRNASLVRKRLSSALRYFATSVSLPFDFPYYGHRVRHITVMSLGFIHMHMWRCHTCYVSDHFQASHVSPMYHPWFFVKDPVGVDHGGIDIFQDKNKRFVHVVWTNAVREMFAIYCNYLNCLFCACPDFNSPRVTFSATLFSDGRIIYNYQKLTDRSTFPLSSNFRIGLGESIVAEPIHDPEDPWHFVHYSPVSISDRTAFSGQAKVKSIVFTPVANATCNSAATVAECSATPPALGCLWCRVTPSHTFQLRRTSFCTDGYGNGSSITVRHTKCTSVHPAAAAPPTAASSHASTATVRAHTSKRDHAPTTLHHQQPTGAPVTPSGGKGKTQPPPPPPPRPSSRPPSHPTMPPGSGDKTQRPLPHPRGQHPTHPIAPTAHPGNVAHSDSPGVPTGRHPGIHTTVTSSNSVAPSNGAIGGSKNQQDGAPPQATSSSAVGVGVGVTAALLFVMVSVALLVRWYRLTNGSGGFSRF